MEHISHLTTQLLSGDLLVVAGEDHLNVPVVRLHIGQLLELGIESLHGCRLNCWLQVNKDTNEINYQSKKGRKEM